MKSKNFLFGFLGLPFVGLVLGMVLGTSSDRQNDRSGPIVGNVRTFEAAYARWRAEAERSGQQTKLVLALGQFKGLSSETTKARGSAVLDLFEGTLSVVVTGLPEHEGFDVWLVHNQSGPGRSVKPELGDRMIRAGKLERDGAYARLETILGREALSDFKLDLVVVLPAGGNPIDGGLLYASPNVFQKLYYSEFSPQKLVSTRLSVPGDANDKVLLLLPPFRSLIPTLAFADHDGNPALVDLIASGEKLFFEEKFRGNGRTCGTCHPADNNFTIDPAYIATLQINDPLFVAEFRKELNSEQNGGRFFEVPALMHQLGLILENVDGFDDLDQKFVLRGVPHLLSLGLSITPAIEIDGTSPQVLDRTGWGGDGAPGTGTLKEFALQAVFQHFTRTLDRKPGVDFRFPTDSELDAIEAFLLSLGRHQELDLGTLQLKNSHASAGLTLFNSDKKCSLCHFNAGANHNLDSGVTPGTQNANFNIGIEDAGSHPTIAPGLALPRDGGFGTDSSGRFTNEANSDGSFGNGTFNTPSLVEAADSPPFFHNNLVNTIEQAVGFYNLNFFNQSPAANMAQIGPISLTSSDVNQIAAFLRVINALENIRSAQQKLTHALTASNPPRADKLLDLAIVDVKDAIRVLKESPLSLHPDPGAQAILENAIAFCNTARKTGNKAKRDASINLSLDALAEARRDIVF
jgi:cytochrome c peroxidase